MIPLPLTQPSTRERVGPTSRRRSWWVLVDKCARCGAAFPVGEVTWAQYAWVRAWNRRLLADGCNCGRALMHPDIGQEEGR